MINPVNIDFPNTVNSSDVTLEAKAFPSNINMSLGHSEVSFNHSCLKVPVDSLSRRPRPRYERLSSAKSSPAKGDKKEKYPLSNLYNNFKSVKSYLEFYESIPDYSELHHLSNEEFYSRLKSLKITQKRFCSVFDSVEDDSGRPFTCCGFASCHEPRKTENKKDEVCACCSVCSPDKEYCNALDFYDKKPKFEGGPKQPPPKINIISDNENASDPFELEFKKHSGYEADQESSTLQPGDKVSNKQRDLVGVGDECLLGDYSRRARSLPISPGCECESPEYCHRFSEISFRNEGHRSRYGSSCCVSDKDKSSIKEKPKKVHSRPIPLTSRIPLFDKIMMEKEARRRVIHDRYSEELRSLVKPFSFTRREEEKERVRMISSNPELTSSPARPSLVRFKAKPIPKNLFSNYAYERMKEEEFYRALKRRIRAEELLKSSCLPPSMALRERMKCRSKSLDFLDYRSPKKSWNKTCGYRRACKNIKKEIEFDEKSSDARAKGKTRSGWMSGNRRINSATDSSTEISPYESVLESRRKSRPHSAFSSSRNNLASVLRIETARKRLEKEMEDKLRENQLKNEAKFKARLVRMTPAWRELNFDKDEDLALRLAARRREDRAKRENHQRLMETIYGRVHRMPPLFHKERFPDKNSKLKRSNSEKDIFSYGDHSENHKTDEPCEDLEEEEEKNRKCFSSPASMELKEKSRSRESSESIVSCGKNEKGKVYESDDTLWQNEA